MKRLPAAALLAAAALPAFAQAPARPAQPVEFVNSFPAGGPVCTITRSDIPTVAEAGVPRLEQEVFYLAMVPAATPEPLAQANRKVPADALVSRVTGMEVE